ncbi:hypothetical protein GTP41_02010 [Pseudoduganella sp. DS3]|uniref:DUF2863 family protein n=1 Tax=Pseudoduganella guangdongensis TaxID=2692179 RepID=A0A6N9HDC4_9BURK|nr:hypothetical protein [Pseudoduganella guangdongensis]MYN00865.1 hypothetical protein [Pseudoduganella guangdongensis]
MQKNKRPAPRKSPAPTLDKEETLSQELCSLALAQEPELRHAVRRYLRQGKDAVLFGAIELARGEDVEAYRLLKETVEEDAGTVLLRKGDGPEMEINAFAIPLFVHSQGGLREADGFQDEAAYAALLDSFTSAGLEGPKAKVVLVQHAYDLAEMDAIRPSQLNAMVNEAAAALLDKKVADAPALLRSIAGWQPASFGAADEAVELRFLLGFALKRADDPFYSVPPAGKKQDAWFAARMQRYQDWTVSATPLLQRCLACAAQAPALRINFLYQDLFYGALQQGRSEHWMLAMMADFGAALAADGGARAVITLVEGEEDAALGVQLLGSSGELAHADRRLDVGDDVEAQIDDLRDALATLGIEDVTVELTAP